MSLVLGIDPGSRVTGYGLIDVQGNRLSYVDCGCIRTEGGALPARLKKIFDELLQLVETHRPSQVAMEEVFVGGMRRLHLNSDRPEVPRWQPVCNQSSRFQNIPRGR